MGSRNDKPRFSFPRIEWPGRNRRRIAEDGEQHGRTYTLRESPSEQRAQPVPPPPTNRSYIDWRGIGILVTTSEFVDRLLGITGELLTTAGVFVLLFLGWHIGFNDYIAGIIQDKNSANLTQEWNNTPSANTAEFDRSSGNALGAIGTIKTPVTKSPANAHSFATIIIPRFGPHYVRTIAQSVDVASVLNNLKTGVGHYTESNELGSIGNFALAGHRTTYGAPFGDMANLRVGDRIYIETKAGWYVYRFRNFEWVYPNETDVLNAVPRTLLAAKDRVLTMTSCHPKLSAAERIIGFSVFESFVPRDAGTPSEIVKMVGGN